MTADAWSRMSAPGYRADIDGLRAVAVLGVVLYHLDAKLLPGGFVGVDIFFVISGYLITRIIWSELQEQTFSLASFYWRRLRRIAPAFFVMVAATIVAGTFLLLPEDLLRLSGSAAWASLYAANIYFWRNLDTGYFADAAAEEPLLHTWSLAIEEQFYLLWPPLLMLAALMRVRRQAVAAMAAVACIASFPIGEAVLATHAKFAYFMLPARGGELMVGAILALAPAMGMGSQRRGAEPMAILGFGLLAFSFFGLDHQSTFPGWNAVYPCAGAALCMLAGQRSLLVRAVLANRPMIAIGLISYSLYLWHWPVLAFTRYFFGALSPFQMAGVLTGAFALAILSYRFVEQPARRMRAPRAGQAIGLVGAPALCIVLFGLLMGSTGGLKRWIESQPGFATVEADTLPAFRFNYICQIGRHDPTILDQPRCVLGPATSGEPRVLLWGDSHASHFAGVVGTIAETEGLSFRNATHAACPPVFTGDYGVEPYREGCSRFRPNVAERLLRNDYDTVLMAARWSLYDDAPAFRADLARTVDSLTARGVRVVLLAEVPRFEQYNRECDQRWSRIDGSGCTHLAVPDTMGGANRFLRELALASDKVSFVDVRSVLCTRGWCRPYLDGRPVYFDAGHLSMSGSWRVGEALARGRGGTQWKAALLGEHIVAGDRDDRETTQAEELTTVFDQAALPPKSDAHPALL